MIIRKFFCLFCCCLGDSQSYENWKSLELARPVVGRRCCFVGCAWNFFLHSRHFTCLLLGPFTSLSIYSYLDTIKRAKWGPATKSTDDDGNGTSQRNGKHRVKERKKNESMEKLSVIGEQQQYNATKTQHSQNPRDVELRWWPMEAAAVCKKRNYPPESERRRRKENTKQNITKNIHNKIFSPGVQKNTFHFSREFSMCIRYFQCCLSGILLVRLWSFKKNARDTERERENQGEMKVELVECWKFDLWKKLIFFPTHKAPTNVREVRGFGRPSLSSFSSSDTTWDADHMFMMSLMPIAHTAQIHSPLRESRAWAYGAKSPLWA